VISAMGKPSIDRLFGKTLLPEVQKLLAIVFNFRVRGSDLAVG